MKYLWSLWGELSSVISAIFISFSTYVLTRSYLMVVHRILRVVRQNFIKLASGVARLIIKPSGRPICAQRANTEAVQHSPPSPPHDNNISVTTVDPAVASSSSHEHKNKVTNVSSDVKDNNISTSASSSSSSTLERSGWDVIKTASYDRHWKAIEDKILQDIEPLAHLAKSILHSGKYRNGDRLTKKDEKDVIEKLLKYHYGFRKKIGSGLKYIMVNRHVEFEDTRCMYVVQTDGSRMDFSYKKCLRGYVEHKYPSHAEKFVQRNLRLVK